MDHHCDRCDRTWTGRAGDRCRVCCGGKQAPRLDAQTPEAWREVWGVK